MSIDTNTLKQSILNLERALEILKYSDSKSSMYDICRAACTEHFEIGLKQSGELLREYLATYYVNERIVEIFDFEDIFRYAGNHKLLDIDTVERWVSYKSEYGSSSSVLPLQEFIADAKVLIRFGDVSSDE